MDECKYKVAWPLGKSAYQPVSPKSRVSDLNGKTICELSDWSFRSEEIFPLVRESLKRRYPSSRFVDYTVFGNMHGHKASEVVAGIPALLRKHGCDAVISGVGG